MPIEVLINSTFEGENKILWHVWQHKEDSVNALLCNWSDAPFVENWNYILT